MLQCRRCKSEFALPVKLTQMIDVVLCKACQKAFDYDMTQFILAWLDSYEAARETA